MKERELIACIRRGDQRGAEALLRDYGPLMRYIIAPILPDQRDQEECLSEAAMQVWQRIEQFDPARGSWNAWLTALTRNLALNRARARRSRPEEPFSHDLPAQQPTPEDQLLLEERREQLKRALAQLSDRERLLFYRKYYYRQSTQQIAAELEMTPRAVEGKLYRLRQRLRGLLEGGRP